MRYCGCCGTTPCRFIHPLIEKETPVDKDEIEVHEIDPAAEPEVVAVLEDDVAAEEEAIARGYRRRGVIWIGEQDLWHALALGHHQGRLRHVEFDQATMTWKVYLDSEALPLVAPYTEAR